MKKLLLVTLFVFIFPLFCFADFTDNGNETITDNDTGLVWMKATADTDSDGNPDSMNWEDALTYCNNLALAGNLDWRLPTVNELQSIVDYNRYYDPNSSFSPTIDTDNFPDTLPDWYWSSTTYVEHTNNAWAVWFYYGYVEGKPKTLECYVRAVRGG